MQLTSPCFSLDIEPDPRNPHLFAWSLEKDPLVFLQSLTFCANAPICAGQCRSSSQTHPAHPTPNQSEPRASQSQIKTTAEEAQAEELDKVHGFGALCFVETQPPDTKTEIRGFQEEMRTEEKIQHRVQGQGNL